MTSTINLSEFSAALERAYSTRHSFRSVSLADAWPLWEATRNPAFNTFLSWDPPDDVKQVLTRVDLIAQAHRRGELAALSVLERDTGEWAGILRVLPWARDPRAVEVSFWLHPKFWNGAASVHFMRISAEILFRFTGADAAVARVHGDHVGCARLMRKSGLVPVGPASYLHENGHELSLVLWELTRERWKQTYNDRDTYEVFNGPALSAPVREGALVPERGVAVA